MKDAVKLIAIFICVMVVLLVGAIGCGPTVATIAKYRTDLLYGYYGQDSATVMETTPHANVVWAAEFNSALDQMAALTFAKQSGVKSIVPMPLCLTPLAQIEGEATAWLSRLRDAGLLDGVIAVAWCDEPNTERSGAWSDADATAAIAAVRRAMVAVGLKAAVATIYACKPATRPGAASADWVGCDDYDSGCDALTKFYDPWTISSTQRFILLPGGADPWRQNPACFEARAHNDERVALLLPFLWQTVTDGTLTVGIRENGMRDAYCQVGARIKGSTINCTQAR